jgi:UDP-N-acetyl-D-mannosaminuronate dehydrogenase
VRLSDKIESRQAVVAVVGLGYVDLPLATAFAKAGFYVVGIDADPSKVEAVNSGRSYIPDVLSKELAALTLLKTTVENLPQEPRRAYRRWPTAGQNGQQSVLQAWRV